MNIINIYNKFSSFIINKIKFHHIIILVIITVINFIGVFLLNDLSDFFTYLSNPSTDKAFEEFSNKFTHFRIINNKLVITQKKDSIYKIDNNAIIAIDTGFTKQKIKTLHKIMLDSNYKNYYIFTKDYIINLEIKYGNFSTKNYDYTTLSKIFDLNIFDGNPVNNIKSILEKVFIAVFILLLLYQYVIIYILFFTINLSYKIANKKIDDKQRKINSVLTLIPAIIELSDISFLLIIASTFLGFMLLFKTIKNRLNTEESTTKKLHQ